MAVYFENLNNRARVIIFDIGWDPGYGVGGPGGGFLMQIAVVACHYFYPH